MASRFSFALTAALALLLGLGTGAAGCGGKGEEHAPARKGAVAKNKIKGSPGFRKRILKKASRPRLRDGGVPEARKSDLPTPPELIGVWEKTDFPGRGMRIAFPEVGGLAEVKVETAPPNDADALAFFVQRARGDREKGKRNADCFANWWVAGTVKYAHLRPSGPARWSGGEVVQAVMRVLQDCTKSVTKLVEVDLKLDGPDLLVASKPADAAAKRPAEPAGVWKRVVEKKIEDKPEKRKKGGK